MPGLRLLFRMAPFLVGAVAVGVWLLRRAGRKALPPGVRERELAAGSAPEAGDGATSEAGVGGANDSLHGERAEPPRFQREPIDIVMVVDDLLQGGR
jgi:hypothetical protein